VSTMAKMNATLTFKLTNPDDLWRLAEAHLLAAEIAEDQPWNDDAKRIMQLIEEASKGLQLKHEKN
jgi:hypothetical protein